MKLCECGCGNPTRMAKRNRKRDNHVKGQPLRFIHGHHLRCTPRLTGKDSPHWKGGVVKNSEGRIKVLNRNHSRADHCGYVFRSIVMVEKVIGKPIPAGAVVHHIDEDVANDKNTNFVLCENDNYHRLLHKRKRAHDACGDVNFRKCNICKKYDVSNNLYIAGTSGYHRSCKSKYDRERKQKIKEAA